MKEDIKILEEYLNKQDRKFVSKDRFKFLQAIENIINHNKKLDRENQALFEAEVCGDTALLLKELQELKEENEHLKELLGRKGKGVI